MANAAPTSFCDPCKDYGEEQVSVAFCLECREHYCKDYLDCHKKQKASTSHSYVEFNINVLEITFPCESCEKNEMASFLCTECRELYCTTCAKRHRRFKVSKNHLVLEFMSSQSKTETAKITSDLSACSLKFDVTYSGAQVPIETRDQGNEEDTATSHGNVTETSIPVPADNKNTSNNVSKPSHKTATHSDVKQLSLSATFYCKFSVRTQTNSEKVHINRMIALPDGRIVAVDYNKKIQLLSDNYVLMDEVDKLGCQAVTCVDDETVAVAVMIDILCYSVKGNKISQTERKLRVDGDIYDIAYRRGEFITRYKKGKTDYICCGNKIIVKQHRLLILSDFMHYDPDDDHLLLCNTWSGEYTVTCYTLGGDVKWSVKLNGEPNGIVALQDVVLVADYSKQTICEVTKKGQLLSTPLLTHSQGISEPKVITYQHKQHRLLVSEYKGDKVTVFNLSVKE